MLFIPRSALIALLTFSTCSMAESSIVHGLRQDFDVVVNYPNSSTILPSTMVPTPDAESTPPPPTILAECSQYGDNFLFTCECDGQYAIVDDGRFGFVCQADAPEGTEGCELSCPPGFVIVYDIGGSPICKQIDNALLDFKMYCSGNSVDDQLDQEHCHADGQFTVNSDCTDGFYCVNRLPEGGESISCPDGEIIVTEFGEGYTSHKCRPTSDENVCPGMGGYTYGAPVDTIPQIQAVPRK